MLGNSNIADLDFVAGTARIDGTPGLSIDSYLDEMRFSGTYFEYLASLGGATNPELGAWGVHNDGSQAWAVIDHNSTFSPSLIPEPTAAGMLLAVLGLGRRRTRR